MNIIEVNFTPEFRSEVVALIKGLGIKRAELHMLDLNLHPSFVKDLIKSIISKEGW
jgi:hypothetical protein